jgi:hypothetical protein
VNIWSRLAIFAIMEKNHVRLYKWRPGGILYVGGVVTYIILSVLVKDRIVEGPLINLNACLSLS